MDFRKTPYLEIWIHKQVQVAIPYSNQNFQNNKKKRIWIWAQKYWIQAEKKTQYRWLIWYFYKLLCKSKHRWLCAQKLYKLRQTKLSQFVNFSFVLREGEDKNQIFRTPECYWTCNYGGEISAVMEPGMYFLILYIFQKEICREAILISKLFA